VIPRILNRVRVGTLVVLLSAALNRVPGEASPAAAASSKHVRATLAPAVASIQPGRPFLVGVRLQMDPGWHTYWRNPGDSGLPTRIRWALPAGFAAGEIQWPRPQRFLADPLMSYGYAGEAWLLTEIRPPSRLAGAEAAIAAKIDWLECQDVCIPGKAELAIALPVKDAVPQPGEHAAAIERARALVPAAARFKVSVSSSPGALRLEVAGVVRPRQAYFFPGAANVVEHGLPQKLELGPRGFAMSLPRAANGAAPERLDGVLELDGHAFEVSAPVRSGVPVAAAAADRPRADR
jgi:thiol:disulfide interchange protein DsbD